MKDSTKIAATLTAVIIIISILFFGLITASRNLGRKSPDLEKIPEVYFWFFSNTIGLAIGLVGTSVAIILAYNALRVSQTQTTLIALQEYRSEIEDFVKSANSLFDKFIDFLRSSAGVALETQYIRSSVSDYSLGIITEEDLDERLERFESGLTNFKTASNELGDALADNRNIFYLEMMARNTEAQKGRIEEFKSICLTHNAPQFSQVEQINRGTSHRSILNKLSAFASDPNWGAFAKSGMESPEEDQNKHYAISGFIEFLNSGDERYIQRVEALGYLLSRYLPALADYSDFDPSPIYEGSDDGDAFTTDEYTKILDSFPDLYSIEKIKEKSVNHVLVYEYLIPICAAMINPSSGIEAIREHLVRLGCQKDIINIALKSHELRLNYNFRYEANIFKL